MSIARSITTKPLRNRRILSRGLTAKMQAYALNNAIFPANSNVNGYSIHQRIALATDFDAVRILIPNIHTAAVTGVQCAVAVPSAVGAWATAAPASNSSGAAVNTSGGPQPGGGAMVTVSPNTGVSNQQYFHHAKFNNATSATLPAAPDATNFAASWTATDWISVASVARTDSPTYPLPLLDVRLFYPSTETVTLGLDANNGNFAYWGRDDFNYGRVWRAWDAAADLVSLAANNLNGSFASLTTINHIVPIIVQYRAKKDGISLVVVGDSIYQGMSSTLALNGFAHKSVYDLHSSAVPVDLCPIVIPAGTMAQVRNQLSAVIDYIQPTILAAEGLSTNDVTSTLDARTSTQYGPSHVGQILELARRNNSVPIICSMFPVKNSYKAWGATDSYRIALNTALLNQAAVQNYIYCNFGAVIDGATVNGQIEPTTDGGFSDGVHPNDAGHDLLKTAFVTAIISAIGVL